MERIVHAALIRLADLLQSMGFEVVMIVVETANEVFVLEGKSNAQE